MHRPTILAYAPHAGTAAFVSILLVVDAHASASLQHALGALTFAILLVVARAFPRHEQLEMWWCVAFSTSIELACTQLWGLYGYRLGNVPLYVPPGHGLLYLFAQSASRTPLLARTGQRPAAIALAIATAWALVGLFAAPGGRRDVHGALYLPFFVVYLLRSPRAGVFVATFAITTWIEWVGVCVGTWHWSATMPGLGVPSGDPPSLIAGGYCFFGEVARVLAAATTSSFRRARWISRPP